ncbi:MAG: hypothetical protein II505_07740, partial [Bacteroidaceae bacterium]|nr:hypothetical protein [Bacteroidaceae bacterium]
AAHYAKTVPCQSVRHIGGLFGANCAICDTSIVCSVMLIPLCMFFSFSWRRMEIFLKRNWVLIKTQLCFN